jgi:hypothetical protein
LAIVSTAPLAKSGNLSFPIIDGSTNGKTFFFPVDEDTLGATAVVGLAELGVEVPLPKPPASAI